MDSKDKEINKIKQELNELIDIIFQAKEVNKPIDEIERHVFRTLLIIGKQLIMLYVNEVSNKVSNKVNGYQNKGKFTRTYFSIFGKISFSREKYYSKEKRQTIYPTDIALCMPKEEYSYNLQDWIGLSATDMDFRSSVGIINRIFGHDIKEIQAERISNKLSEEVEIFYKQETHLNKEEEGSFFAAGFDDKGVPILPAEVNRVADSSGMRLGKGQKKGVKKSSTVSVTYSFNPNIRTAEKVVASLFKEKKYNENNSEESIESKKDANNKHTRAFLSDKKKAIEYGFDNILKRSPEKKKDIVVLVDGDRGLEQAINRAIEAKGIKERVIFKVLDFIHVTEYLWKAANIYYGEKSPLRLEWVKQQCLLLLKGEHNATIKNLHELIQDCKYKTSKCKMIESVIKYLMNHKHMMNYKECLARGFPISTGAIESACGHFVQSRMERNGMRWSLKGAMNMLNLRAINKNKDWGIYMKYYIEKKQMSNGTLDYKMVA